MGFHIEVSMTERFALVGALVDEIAAAQSRKAAYRARDRAKELVPVATGALKNSIVVNRLGRGEYELSAGEGTPRDYAAAVEFGTYKMAAKPYFIPGMEAGRQIMAAEPEKKL